MLIQETSPTTWNPYSIEQFQTDYPVYASITYYYEPVMLPLDIYQVRLDGTTQPVQTTLAESIEPDYNSLTKKVDGYWYAGWQTINITDPVELTAITDQHIADSEDAGKQYVETNYPNYEVELALLEPLAESLDLSASDTISYNNVRGWISSVESYATNTVGPDLTIIDPYDPATWASLPPPSADIAACQLVYQNQTAAVQAPPLFPTLNRKDAIRKVLNGRINASAGYTHFTEDGTVQYILSPVPDLAPATAILNVPVPSFTTPVDLNIMVEEQAGGTWWKLSNGANSIQSGTITITIDKTNSQVIINATSADFMSSGFLAFEYV